MTARSPRRPCVARNCLAHAAFIVHWPGGRGLELCYECAAHALAFAQTVLDLELEVEPIAPGDGSCTR